MNSDPRHHHYIPQCYLRGFTKGSGKDSKLKVFDMNRRRVFDTAVRNVCGRRDFNRVDVKGVPPNAIECAWSDFEGGLASALREVGQTRVLAGSNKGFVLTMIALFAVRSPQMREHWRAFHAKIIDQMMGVSLMTKERWLTSMAEASMTASLLEKGITYEDMKAFYEEKRYDIKVSNAYHIASEMEMIDTLQPILADRKWLLVVAPEATCPFVTNDRPVFLYWKRPKEVPPLFRDSPGFGLRDTTLQITLTKELALIGEFDGSEGTVIAPTPMIAAMNTRTSLWAFEQIYAPSSSFLFAAPDHSIMEGGHLFSAFPKEPQI